MDYFMVRDRKTGRLLSGTDFRYNPPHHIFASEYRPPLLLSVNPKINSSELRRRNIRLNRFELVRISLRIGTEVGEKDERAAGHELDANTRERAFSHA